MENGKFNHIKFVAPILQGVIICLVVSLLGGAVTVYAEFQRVKDRVGDLETAISKIDKRLSEVPLCRLK